LQSIYSIEILAKVEVLAAVMEADIIILADDISCTAILIPYTFVAVAAPVTVTDPVPVVDPIIFAGGLYLYLHLLQQCLSLSMRADEELLHVKSCMCYSGHCLPLPVPHSDR